MSIKIYYPAVFQKEDEGYSAWVPDLDGCISQGGTVGETAENINEAIGLMLETLAEHGKNIPAPSKPETIPVKADQFVTVIAFDPAEYEGKYSTKAVKKTLTIPSWLNTIAESAHINFSSVLQEALLEKFHLKN